MAPQTGSALILLVAFVLPGFITVLLQERTFKSAEDLTPFDRLLRTLYYSVWCYSLLALVALVTGIDRASVEDLVNRYDQDPAELVWRGVLIAVVPPLVVATTTRLWADSRFRDCLLARLGINARHEQPTGWDFFFRQRPNVYVRVTMKDGSRVLGFYGADSFAAYAKDGRDLYLERVYAPDEGGWFGEENARSRGVWVRTDDAICVEFYNPVDGEQRAEESAGATRGQTTDSGGSPSAPDDRSTA